MIFTKAERTGHALIAAAMCAIGLSMVLPIVHVIAQSFSSSVAINTGQVTFWPVGWTTGNYGFILRDPSIWLAFRNSLIVTVPGTLINLAATASLAYPLSRREYLGRKLILLLILITLIFHAPLIPNYLLIKELGLLNTLWALMLPSAISAFNLFVMRSFFMNLPAELMDSGKMDGCGELRLLWHIVLPLSRPAMATMGIIYAVANWNTYSAAVYYINKRTLVPLQVRLREIVFADMFGSSDPNGDLLTQLSPEGVKMAVIVVATVPIMLVYPFLQKHFIQGMLVGSIKS
ncbi:carbohydrate ABC transporter permease [Paenibacillus hamazuiensis]|uniref:carbohydrate ABC transporter permease n=1 Tax=Paenibacillus hamazuiensis TaxID=2936508 RepID=UPI00200CF6D3|nr:carbohydrate ABC transporter permease [Paenibacillus hamazuiensis]